MSIQGITKSRLFWPLVALFLLVMVNFWFNPDFFSIRIVKGGLYGSVIDIINRAAPVMLIAMGMTLVIATRGIDISVGATVAISGAIAAALIGGSLEIKDGVQTYVSQTPMPLAILAALGVGLLCGLWNGFLVAGIGMQPIIATLILMVAGRGIAQLITGGQIVTIYYEPFFFFGNGFFLGIPFAIYLVAAVAAVLLLLVHKTALGLFIQAVGLNPTAARFSGISARALIFWVYGFCGVTAAVAGVIVASNVKSADGNNAGLMMELDAILAVALGGTLLDGGRFSLVGTLIGALILQTLSYAIYSLGVPPEINLVVKAIVVFVVCLIQSEALRKMLFQRRAHVEGQP
ncbi:MAG: ABC transporter permease [Propionivibrio sp.]|jgi:ribose/xylose/arabinose/galactoside ABC-type transport system permease subunit|uniref:ABC transporter permease n=1 Tax=Propionivibrio sp. TaxID=2212460 RepID=UPI001B3F5F24|nr:ABC transporter permease [Propionivibrio sp.]MBP7204370.1 ABC transporter permease [Propionivibrio sp.]